MLISSHNKNSLINLERKYQKHQKPQIFHRFENIPKCIKKCMNSENKWKKKGKRVLSVYEDKNLAKELEENDKKMIGSLDRSKREKRVFKKV